jgi:GAF domain-containing protein
MAPAEVEAEHWMVAAGQVLARVGSASRQVHAQVDEHGVTVTFDGGDPMEITWSTPTTPPVAIDLARLRRELAGAAGEAEACAIVLAEAHRVVPAESGAVLLVERGYLRFAAATGPRAGSLVGVRLPLTSGVAGYAVQTQRPVLVGEATGHPRHYGALDDLTGYETHQLLAMPISHAGTVLGVLELINPPSDGSFGPGALQRVEGLVMLLATQLVRR